MWQEIARLVQHHAKGVGITGDSLTFGGSILLTLEALFKRVQFVSIKEDETIIKYFPSAVNRKGKKINPALSEESWMKLWLWVSRGGALLLLVGFGLLLALRLYAE